MPAWWLSMTESCPCAGFRRATSGCPVAGCWASSDSKRSSSRPWRLTELLAGKALLGIKDPRMPRLMPIWQAAFDALGLWVDYVIAARHPLSVAGSLLLPVTTLSRERA